MTAVTSRLELIRQLRYLCFHLSRQWLAPNKAVPTDGECYVSLWSLYVPRSELYVKSRAQHAN